ncbi:phenazine biosynthesis FMN-dependent oxidase PhzG [Phaeospirillum tilakii]|uniref:Phenazine biosynthesis FMN-dependent oxidase PhzG n=1 Tax=Phaeospirillum tilakii TaxID=741673 RepID=A0ABW5C5Q2_9PROT
MGVNLSETLTGTIELPFPEYLAPPDDPIALLRGWMDKAEQYVREPRALALATVDDRHQPSSRIVVINEISDTGVLFSTHAGSQKGRDLALNPVCSGVLYWRETCQQIVLAGRARRLPDDKADALWLARPFEAHPMSVAARQSEDLLDVEALRLKARRLAQVEGPLPRPAGYAVFEIALTSLEFWSNGTERLHERLRYDRDGDGWTSRRLQP